jgi:predicted ATPase
MIHHLNPLRSVPFWKKKPLNFRLPFPSSAPLTEIKFTSPVTFLVGENGSGKSTVLEAIACSVESITVGAESVKTDKTLARSANWRDTSAWRGRKRTRKGFFLRAEDFFGYAKSMRQTREELEQDLKDVDRDYKGRSKYAADLARSAYRGQLAAMEHRYGGDLDNYSHGESFLTLFQARFVPGGLYLLDEPEAALSPMRQLTFLSAVKQMVQEQAQFIIATHSPIILAFPMPEDPSLP